MPLSQEEREKMLREAAEKREEQFADQNGTGGEESKDSPLGSVNKNEERVSQRREESHELADEIISQGGYNPVQLDELPSRGLFYPLGTKIQFRAAQVREIRQFTALEENDLIDVDSKLSMILEKCVRFFGGDKRLTHKDLVEADKFYMLFLIRELTFKDKPSKIMLDAVDPETGEVDKVELTSNNFSFFEPEDKVMRHYDEEERCFRFASKNPAVGTFRLYVPTVGTMTKILREIVEKTRNNQGYDKSFYKFLPYLIKDYRTLNEKTKINLKSEVDMWSLEKVSAVDLLIEKIQFGVEPEITHYHSASGEEVRIPINFRRGLKELFLVDTDILEEF